MGEWEKERKGYYEEKRWKIEKIELMRERTEIRDEELVKREKRVQEEERWKKINNSEYNKWYGYKE